LLPYPRAGGSSGHVSPGVPLLSEEGKAVPLCPKVQFQGFDQDVERGVAVPVKDEPTPRTDVRPHREGLLDDALAMGALLAGEVWLHGQYGDVMQHPIVLHPAQERSPSRIVNGLGKMAVVLHVAYLEVFKGNQVARRDERVRLFAGEILTLPLDLEIRFGQDFPGFLPILSLRPTGGNVPRPRPPN
jgi:hypothetical protein